jgi:putative flippase GtrA
MIGGPRRTASFSARRRRPMLSAGLDKNMLKQIERWLSPEMIKFLVVGGISYLVNQAALALMYEQVLADVTRRLDTAFGTMDLALLLASVVAVEIAIIARFLLNDHWTFRRRRDKPFVHRFVQSNFGSLGSPLISLATVNILTPLFDINYLVSNSIGIALGLAWNWGWSTRVVWRPAEEAAEAE